jgi:hypothetical protein
MKYLANESSPESLMSKPARLRATVIALAILTLRATAVLAQSGPPDFGKLDSNADMTTPAKLADGTVLQNGMGIKVGEHFRGLRYIGHVGTAPGFRSDATWYPDARMAVVVLMNTFPANLSPSSVGGEMARALLPLPHPTRTSR